MSISLDVPLCFTLEHVTLQRTATLLMCSGVWEIQWNSSSLVSALHSYIVFLMWHIHGYLWPWDLVNAVTKLFAGHWCAGLRKQVMTAVHMCYISNTHSSETIGIGFMLLQHFPFGMTSGVTSWSHDIKLCDTFYNIGSEIDNFHQCMIKINVTLCCT